MKRSPNVQAIETTRRTAFFGSYRDYLDGQSPGEALAAKEFYEIIDGTKVGKFSNRLFDCRTYAWFVRHKVSGKVRIAAKQCRLRWCFHCSEARQQYITHSVSEWWDSTYDPKLLTVTVKHSDAPLPEQIDHLYKSFVKLRNRKYLKDKIKGGIWFFQITWNDKRKEWHPHIHALIDSPYLDHSMLKYLWNKITLTSTNLHIRAVHDRDATLQHNARYAARPSSLLSIPKVKWPELFESFAGRRICGSWGSAKAVSLRPAKPEDAADWQQIGGFKIVAGLITEDDNAKAIWKAWKTGGSLEADIDMSAIEVGFGWKFNPHPPPKRKKPDPAFTWGKNSKEQKCVTGT